MIGNSRTTTPVASNYSDSFKFSVGTSFSAPLVAGTGRALQPLARHNQAMALLHENLYGSGKFAQVDLAASLVPDRHVERFAVTIDDTISILAPLTAHQTGRVLRH